MLLRRELGLLLLCWLWLVLLLLWDERRFDGVLRRLFGRGLSYLGYELRSLLHKAGLLLKLARRRQSRLAGRSRL